MTENITHTVIQAVSMYVTKRVRYGERELRESPERTTRLVRRLRLRMLRGSWSKICRETKLLPWAPLSCRIEERQKGEQQSLSLRPGCTNGWHNCCIIADVAEANLVSNVVDIAWSGSKTTIPGSNDGIRSSWREEAAGWSQVLR